MPKSCCQKFLKIHRETSSLESLFNKVVGWKPETVLRASNFIKKRLRHRSFPVNFTKFSRASILKNICEQSKRFLLNFIKKETLTQVFSCKFCKFFRSINFVEHLRTGGSETPVYGFLFNKVASLIARMPLIEQYQKETLAQVFFCEFCEIFRKAFLQDTSQEPLLT